MQGKLLLAVLGVLGLAAGPRINHPSRIDTPAARASADFDEDGIADLVTGDRNSSRGRLMLQRGDASVTVFDLPEPADFLGAGDFDNDGHMDLLASGAGSRAIYLLRGDGQGGLAAPESLSLPGPLEAMATGEINRPDGLADFVVAVRKAGGSELLVYEDPLGAWQARPETFELASQVADLALSDLDGDFLPEAVVAAGRELLVLRGRDRKLSLGSEARCSASPARLERYAVGFRPTSIAVGRFLNETQPHIAALSDDGSVRLAPATLPGVFEELESLPPGGRLAREQGSDRAHDRLIWLDDAGGAELLAGSDLTGPVSTLTTFTVTSTNDSGAGSLRSAILGANGLAGADAISFNIPGSAPYVITPLSPLPDITDPVTIDGTTQPGYAGTPLIQLNGASAGAGVEGLLVSSGSTTLRGLVVRDFDGHGIRLRSNGGNTVERCYIGTDVTGTVARPNHQDGVRIENSAVNTIGGTAAGASNVISGNLANGVEIDPGPGITGSFSSTDVPKPIFDFTTVSSVTNAVLSGPVIGVRVTVLIQHTFDGDLRLVLISPDGTHVNLSLNNGGSGDDYRNTVFDDAGTVPITAGAAPFTSPPSYIPQSPLSAFAGGPAGGPWMLEVSDTAGGDSGELLAWSIQITAAPSYSNQIFGNLIGTNASGSSALGNQVDGVRIVNSPANNIGASSPGARNVISGNVVIGVETVLAGAAKNFIQGNYIGTDRTGTTAISPGIGVYLKSDQNLVGGTGAGARNMISGNGSMNQGVGIWITGKSNLVQGNFIGTDPAGTSSVPNTTLGVVVQQQLNSIGGGVAGAGNLVSGNGGTGIQVFGGGNNDTIQGNLIGTNVSGTAALPNAGSGVELFDSDTILIGGSTPAERNVISGNKRNGVDLPLFQIHHFGGSRIQGNYIGTNITGTAAIGNEAQGVAVATDSNLIGGPLGSGQGNLISGNLMFGVNLNDPSQLNTVQGNIVGLDAGASSVLGNLAGGIAIGPGGVGSGGHDNIIGGGGPGEGNIVSGNGGPGIRVTGPVSTTTVNSPSTDVPKAIPDLSLVTSTLTLSDTAVIADIKVQLNITHTFDSDLLLSLLGPNGILIVLSNRRGGSGDNFSGTIFDDAGSVAIASGTAPFSSPPSYMPEWPLSQFKGIPVAGTWKLQIQDLAGGDVGTLNSWSLTLTTPAGGAGSRNQILGNRIGTDGAGVLARGNTGPGILLQNAPANKIGDTPASSGNLISANQRGIEINGTGSIGNVMQSNLIGTQANGISPLGNLSDGIMVASGGYANWIGSSGRNTIAFNGGSGVRVASGRGNNIQNNSLHGNAGLGIDLDPPGVNPNDLGDGDTGPNDLLNYPVVTAKTMGGSTFVTVSFNGLPNQQYFFEIYANSAPDPSGFGEGETTIFFMGGPTDSAGNVLLTGSVPGSYSFITATANDQARNTSEFSEVVRTVLEASPAKDMKVEHTGAPPLKVTYTPACGATDHVIYWGMAGPAPIGPPGLSWINAACGMGVSGIALFDPGVVEPGRVLYFVTVGQNGSVEGSYGQSSAGIEEPEATLPVVCDLPQYLGGICY